MSGTGRILKTLEDTDLSTIIPISLGWNCSPAAYRGNTLHFLKGNGYLTCPFDLGVTPFQGLCQCLLDDFDETKFFNLRIEYDGINKQDCILNEYNMWFNHESEELHGDERVKWHPGKFSENDFALFKQRYTNRIANFHRYISDKTKIKIFIVTLDNKHDNINILKNILDFKYPQTKYDILFLENNITTYYNQYLHSPDFPTNNDDIEYINKISNNFKTFINHK